MEKDFSIGGQRIAPGEHRVIGLSMAKLFDFTEVTIPVEVHRGKKPGPVLFISSTIHGDEINGIEIIRQLLAYKPLKKLCGTLITIPVVNVFGFNTLSRYLPDRRDLNRSFPGSSKGSMAAQLAHLFTVEILQKCTHGIDLHTGAIHRSNLPQIRGFIDDRETRDLAFQFGVPVIINSTSRDGSLRAEAHKKNIPILLYEAGEALRYNEHATRMGVNGIKSVMRAIGMLPAKPQRIRPEAFISEQTVWTRAPAAGILSSKKLLGAQVEAKEILGFIRDPFGQHSVPVRASVGGIIIGKTQLPLVNKGDALFHIATFINTHKVKKTLDLLNTDDHEM
jgi:predicted deacylase